MKTKTKVAVGLGVVGIGILAWLFWPKKAKAAQLTASDLASGITTTPDGRQQFDLQTAMQLLIGLDNFAITEDQLKELGHLPAGMKMELFAQRDGPGSGDKTVFVVIFALDANGIVAISADDAARAMSDGSPGEQVVLVVASASASTDPEMAKLVAFPAFPKDRSFEAQIPPDLMTILRRLG